MHIIHTFMRASFPRPSLLVMLVIAGTVASAGALAAEPTAIGPQWQLMVDNYLIDKMAGASLVLHQPVKREVAIEHDAPWEGNNCGYHTVFRDGDVYRMYYMIAHLDCGANEHRKEPANHQMTMAAYAESKDGIHWVKPELGQFEFAGSKKNNIIMWDGYDKRTEAFLVPFKDANPNCKPDERYKSLVRVADVLELWALKSADGIHWSRLSHKAVITKGEFDSQNLAFWDTLRGEYRAYFRGYRNGRRDILTATSRDFVNWTEPVFLEYPGSPLQELYTNQIAPYYRAPPDLSGLSHTLRGSRLDAVARRAARVGASPAACQDVAALRFGHHRRATDEQPRWGDLQTMGRGVPPARSPGTGRVALWGALPELGPRGNEVRSPRSAQRTFAVRG